MPKTQLDRSICFDRTPPCDRLADGQMNTYTHTGRHSQYSTRPAKRRVGKKFIDSSVLYISFKKQKKQKEIRSVDTKLHVSCRLK